MEIQRPKPHQEFPADAKKVFSGVLFEVYQWPQKLFDGRTATYERLKRHDSVVILAATTEGKMLVQREQQPGMGWYESAPCGSIDSGESPEAAAARELFEETGYKAQELKLWYSEQIDHRTDWAIYVFVARGCVRNGESNPGAGERVVPREVSFDDFLLTVASDNFKNANIATRLLRAVLVPSEMIALKKRLGIK